MLAPLLDLVLPTHCGGCRSPGTRLCPACRGDGTPILVALDTLTVAAAGRYEYGLRRAVLAYKERGRRDLAGPLGGLLAAALPAVAGARPVVLVPVPSHRTAARARGGDHVRRLATALARRHALGRGSRRAVAVRPELGLVRRTADSAGLDIAARAANLAGAMRAAPVGRAAVGTVVLVDDIVTTGATLREAARALRVAGWPVSGAVVVAATPRRHRPGGPVRDWERPGS